ncbi:TRAP transporter large permease subunit [Allopusillimonas soli]|uniref:TRAP transporter large permease protein n=1 Tax=Allopusillimonas soli TaxID=659016 RepID=A0A853F8G1_9BURK|nr:TRAP transporter large permease subunit [Allopusillimonas soli]NYT35852.1 TRAP transporter large permease subunit [Allopusillimonas soli]TEA76220.1 TRAP transporter large permease subunit [Allopusillimonas soli]
MSSVVAALMFPALFLLIFLGVPISFSLIIPALAAGLYAFGPHIFDQLYGSLYTAATNYVLSAIPMFVLMGAILERSGIAARLFRTMQLWLGRLPGGLAVATIAMAATFAAAAGVVGAVEVMVGMMAIPAMQKFRYNNSLIAGTICAGGSLGTMIPPSVVAVVYASLAQISVGELFAAMLFPGLIMVGLFLVYIVGICVVRPEFGPRADDADMRLPALDKLKITVTGLVPTMLLIVAVLGSLMAGIASPTEAAAVGAAGALVLCICYGQFNVKMMRESLAITVRISAMILLIVAGGIMFTGIFAANGGSRLIQSITENLGLGITGTIIFFLFVVFLLGFVLDWTANVLICVPLFLPLLTSAGIDPIWFGTLMIIVLQTGYLTPPMASSIFYLLSIAPPDMKYGQICKGVVPFILIQFLTLIIVALFPWLATWLPTQVSGF